MPSIRKLGPEHSVDVDLIPERPVVLDVGCRDFIFDRELVKLRPHAKIIALDPDPSIEQPADVNILFLPWALTHRKEGMVKWQGAGEGAYILGDANDPGFRWGVHTESLVKEVRNATIEDIIADYGESYDLIKLDCEGSEFGILENWPGPIAKQISVEFHDFVDRARWNEAYFDKLFAGPLRHYERVLWELTPLGPGNSMGHWDSLLVLR